MSRPAGAIDVRPPVTAEDFDQVRALMREYVSAPDLEEAFAAYLAQQAFAHELEALEAIYAPPQAGILLAGVDGQAAGCVAFKPLEPPAVCEMKRMYVRPRFRGAGVGRRLVTAVTAAARASGYAVMRLDTLPSMHAAQRMYHAMGFREIAPYCDNPVPGSHFMEADLLQVGHRALPDG